MSLNQKMRDTNIETFWSAFVSYIFIHVLDQYGPYKSNFVSGDILKNEIRIQLDTNKCLLGYWKSSDPFINEIN